MVLNIIAISLIAAGTVCTCITPFGVCHSNMHHPVAALYSRNTVHRNVRGAGFEFCRGGEVIRVCCRLVDFQAFRSTASFSISGAPFWSMTLKFTMLPILDKLIPNS